MPDSARQEGSATTYGLINRPFQSPPLKLRRQILAESGVVNPITQLSLLNSIANRHRTVSPCAAAGRLFTVRTVIQALLCLGGRVHTETVSPRLPRLHRIFIEDETL